MQHLPRASFALTLLLTGCPGGATDDDAGDETGSGACEVVGETILDDLGTYVIALAVEGDRIAFVTRTDAASATEIRTAAIDGSGATMVYTSTGTTAVVSIVWAGDDLVFLEAVEGSNGSMPFRLAGGVGPALAIAPGNDPFVGAERLIGFDAGDAFVLTGNPAAVTRLDIASDQTQKMAEASGTGTPIHPVVAAGEIYFVAGAPESVYRVTSTSGPEAVVLGTVGEAAECGFPLGGLAVTPTKLVCGFTDVATFDRVDGMAQDVILDGDLTAPAQNIVVGAVGETIYTIESNDGSFDGAIEKVGSDGSGPTAIACDVGKVGNQTTAGFFPNVTEYLVGFGSAHVVWVEERYPEGSAAVISIRRAAK